MDVSGRRRLMAICFCFEIILSVSGRYRRLQNVLLLQFDVGW